MVDVYQMVTDRIVAALEQGTCPWRKPWNGDNALAVSHVTGKPYSLLNQILLGGVAGEYLTFKQAAEEGGHVKKGEKSKIVVFWKWLDKKDEDGNIVMGDDGEPEKVPYLRYYNVFHISQCEGIEPKWSDPDAAMPGDDLEPDERAEAIIQDYVERSSVKLIRRESGQAYYSPSTDEVVVPLLEQHSSVAEWYSTIFHELTHSTGHSSRLNRFTSAESQLFGSQTYSKEELVAECGAAMLCSVAELETDSSFQNSAAYIQGWLRALKNDKKLIVYAAAKAEKAARLILGKYAPVSADEQ